MQPIDGKICGPGRKSDFFPIPEIHPLKMPANWKWEKSSERIVDDVGKFVRGIRAATIGGGALAVSFPPEILNNFSKIECKLNRRPCLPSSKQRIESAGSFRVG